MPAQCIKSKQNKERWCSVCINKNNGILTHEVCYGLKRKREIDINTKNTTLTNQEKKERTRTPFSENPNIPPIIEETSATNAIFRMDNNFNPFRLETNKDGFIILGF